MVGAFTLGLAGVLSLSSAAQAQPSAGGDIHVNAEGSIIIHKHEAVTDGAQANPDSGPPTDGEFGDPIAGAGFTVTPIEGIDLGTLAGWDKLEQVKISDTGDCTIESDDVSVKPGASLGEKPTDVRGVATFAGLKVGAYLVCETTLPEGASLSSAPFIVTVPTPNAGDWVYDVNVFPKNTVNTIDKIINADDGFAIGSKVSFDVSTTINPLPNGAKYSSFIITDTLDSRLGGANVDSVKIDERTLVAGTDYTVTRGDDNSNALQVDIHPNVVNDHLGGKLTVVFAGTVVSLDDGGIDNTAHLYVNDPNMETDGIPSITSKSKWGDLLIHKHDADNSEHFLTGAVFEVYNSKTPYADQCTSTDTAGGPVSVRGETEFTTKDGGNITIQGLLIMKDDDEKSSVNHRCYVVKEIKAPLGYVTPDGEHAYTPVTVTPGVSSEADVNIKNSQRTVPDLPLTGGAGQAMLIIGGLALAGGGIAAAVLKRRKAAA